MRDRGTFDKRKKAAKIENRKRRREIYVIWIIEKNSLVLEKYI